MIADIAWGFPAWSPDRIEDMDAPELMAWHARAIRSKQRDAEIMQAAMTNAVAPLLNAMMRR